MSIYSPGEVALTFCLGELSVFSDMEMGLICLTQQRHLEKKTLAQKEDSGRCENSGRNTNRSVHKAIVDAFAQVGENEMCMVTKSIHPDCSNVEPA